ncbi:MAG TPA: hypothetical protein VES38_06625 [Methylotenera sp.]|nr:hypothetical protein [Methylotenera sp.]
MNNSLALGASLDADTFVDFVNRLKHDCRGEGVKEHCTADALFIVEKKVIVSGIDTDYTDDWLISDGETEWYSPMDFWKDFDWQAKISLNKECVEEYGNKFPKLSMPSQWGVLEGLKDYTVTGYVERWDYVNAHFTNDAAEAFIRRKKHDYRDGLRVYVDSQYWAWEFNAIKNALMDGTLIYQPKAAS